MFLSIGIVGFIVLVSIMFAYGRPDIFTKGVIVILIVLLLLGVTIGIFGMEQYEEVSASDYINDVQNFKVAMAKDCCVLDDGHGDYYTVPYNSLEIETFSNEELRNCKVEVCYRYKQLSDFGYVLYNFGLFDIDRELVSKTIRIECPENCVIVSQQDCPEIKNNAL